MSKYGLKQAPIILSHRDKTSVRTQFAALCYRVLDGKTQVLLVTSRGTGRWIIPKGWPEHGKTPVESALTEAWEEAGVKGDVTGECLGLFSYQKNIEDQDDLPCVAMVYPVAVKSLAAKYPEKSERKRRWMSPKKAASRVEDPELARLLKNFDPDSLPG